MEYVFYPTLTKESKVPSSMSLAAFLSPRANESIAPKTEKSPMNILTQGLFIESPR